MLAKDISIETVELLSERSVDLPGIETQVEQTREYPEGDLAPHIVGTLGAISQEQYDAAEEAGNTYSASNVSGYSYTDTVGQSGIESVFESTLRGKNGKESVTTDATGKVTSTTVTEPPEAGDSVWLTIDSNVQRAAVNASPSRLKRSRPKTASRCGCRLGREHRRHHRQRDLPNFDLEKYNTDDAYLTQLYADESQPLFNRALNGIFTPGSVFKPLVALAALEEGVITPTSHPVNCDARTTIMRRITNRAASACTARWMCTAPSATPVTRFSLTWAAC